MALNRSKKKTGFGGTLFISIMVCPPSLKVVPAPMTYCVGHAITHIYLIIPSENRQISCMVFTPPAYPSSSESISVTDLFLQE